jgi:hypothetical protein
MPTWGPNRLREIVEDEVRRGEWLAGPDRQLVFDVDYGRMLGRILRQVEPCETCKRQGTVPDGEGCRPCHYCAGTGYALR